MTSFHPDTLVVYICESEFRIFSKTKVIILTFLATQYILIRTIYIYIYILILERKEEEREMETSMVKENH